VFELGFLMVPSLLRATFEESRALTTLVSVGAGSLQAARFGSLVHSGLLKVY
jgi:hypothetical protein